MSDVGVSAVTAGSPAGGPSAPRPWVRVLLVVVPVVAVLALLASALASSGGGSRPVPTGPAPSFVVHDLSSGAAISNADLRGHVAVLNFWASWCAPCRQEARSLTAVWRTVRGKGVVFIGVAYQDDPGASRSFARAHDMTWTIAVDPAAAAARAFGVAGVPETVVLSPGGRIVAHAVGPVTEADLLGWIRDAGRTAAP